ncbi:unnamed protein product [Nezara viridula]|uniref:DNA topoisomerase n=1 Tax=Nezara viridula TaxID=85310 RepID=A0A9P0GVX1_NEZVI|nr:unnamed protein product [Nezara viridula]
MFFKFSSFLSSFSCVKSPVKYYCIASVMKVLNVAEKNDAAKNIAYFLSNGNARRKEGFSIYNKLYEFDAMVFGQMCRMVMTSVSGHLLNYEFVGTYKNWQSCSPESLFSAPVIKSCSPDFERIKKTLESQCRSCNVLIIWTDCDREGENIGFEIIDTCLKIKPNLDVYRAKFSEITSPSVKRAIQNLERPNKLISEAVDVRQVLDLRIGAAFTRFQTLRLQKVFPVLAENLLSYGSCQFPTLGFVVERYLERENFIAEPFWKIKVTHEMNDLVVEFRWARDRLYDEAICRSILSRCQENPIAKVEKVEGKPKSKWRPTPLDTTEMEKIASRKLKINAKEALRIAEKLYTQGLISYPRTETNIFPDSINLSSLVELQTKDPSWGGFARNVLREGPRPRQGKKSDQSHPPIHPILYSNSLSGNEARIYEFIVRHFLACVSKDAKGHETTVKIDINGEKFTASGLMILERNYLDVYPYENWSAKCIHEYKQGTTFTPTLLDISESETTAPNLLTEADLISLMEKHGIGTDATHAEHIEKIKIRSYVGLENNTYFIPSAIGMGLVEGYDTMGFAMSKPHLRAELEADLKRICEGTKQSNIVLQEQVNKYKVLFQKAKEQVNKIDAAMSKYMGENAIHLADNEDPLNVIMTRTASVMPCNTCGNDMVVRKHQETLYISCSAYPACKNSIWLPSKVMQLSISEESCETCGPNVKKLEFKFSPGSMAPYYPQHYIGCLNGCDQDFIEMLGVKLGQTNSGSNPSLATQVSYNYTQASTSSGYHSLSSLQSTDTDDTWDRGGGSNRGQKRLRDDNAGRNDGDVPCCFCNIPAKKLVTRKEGPNNGREFLVCSKNDDEKCNYYMWADELTDVKCYCNISAKKLVVRKPGPNQGKEFYACSKSQADKCNFFQWKNENAESHFSNTSNKQDHTRTPQQFRGRGQNSARGNQRKCRLCHQPGHTRRNCPQNGE